MKACPACSPSLLVLSSWTVKGLVGTTVALRFAWDGTKATANVRKHGVRFEEAATAFGDTLSVTVSDPDHSLDEERYLLLGMTERNRLVVVSCTERRDVIRLISARPATAKERKGYEEGL